MKTVLAVFLRLCVTGFALLTCVGCQSHPHATSKVNVLKETKPTGVVTSSKSAEAKAKPRMFGFKVTSISVELCCSDTPGRPTPTGATNVEGVTPDNVRFMLSCATAADFNRPLGKISREARDHWYEAHTASIENEEDGGTMTIYNFDGKAPNYWRVFAECSIWGRLDRAQNEFPILVYSSSAGDWKNGSGYEVKANSKTENFALKCLQSVQSPCVSVAPATYLGIRDGSELRLCDQNLTVIATYQIIEERSHR